MSETSSVYVPYSSPQISRPVPSEEKQEFYREFATAFYEQSFRDVGVDDDSSFCGYYEPRGIGLSSFAAYMDFGSFEGDTYIVSFMINGFALHELEMRDFRIKDGKLSFIHWVSGNEYVENIHSPFLMPQVWKDGKIYGMVEAYNAGIIGDEVFRGRSYFQPADVIPPLNAIGKAYYDGLPGLLRDGSSHSDLIPRFEETKSRFYEKEIVAKGYTDDSYFRGYYTEEHYKHEVKAIDPYSIHLNYFSELEGFTLYLLSINDIDRDVQSWFGDVTGRLIRLGDHYYALEFQIDPVVELDGEVYFLQDAYEQGIVGEKELAQIDTVFVMGMEDFAYMEGLETKWQERAFYHNPVLQ